MRDLLARRSEAVALEVADLQFAEDGSATALIRRSKTDQAGAGEMRWLAPRTVEQFRRWIAVAGISLTKSDFSWARRSGMNARMNAVGEALQEARS